MRSHRTLALVLPLALAAACSEGPTPVAPDAQPAKIAAAAVPACVDFEPPLGAGTVWGASVGQPPLTFVHAENAIRVYTEKFFLTGGGTAYRDARIGLPPFVFSSGQAARALHINLIFDFTSLPFVPSSYTFDYYDPNGPAAYENLKINGSGVFIGELNAPPPSLAGVGISFAAGPFGAPPSGDWARVKLTPGVGRLTVGGQDVWIDHVCAYP